MRNAQNCRIIGVIVRKREQKGFVLDVKSAFLNLLKSRNVSLDGIDMAGQRPHTLSLLKILRVLTHNASRIIPKIMTTIAIGPLSPRSP
jgi:hypothetical protein